MIPQRQCVLFHDSGCRPTPRPVPAQTDLPPPSRRGVMHCGKATSKEGKGCACGGSCFGGCALSTAHVRRRRIQGCLIRQLMIAKKERTWDLDWDWEQAAPAPAPAAASNQASKQGDAPPTRARHPSPTRFLPTASRHPQQAGGRRKARQGNVRQCKARQGNKAVTLSPMSHVPCSCSCFYNTQLLLPSTSVLAQSAAFGTREHEGHWTKRKKRTPGLKSHPHAGQNEPGLLFPLPRCWAVCVCVGGSNKHGRHVRA